MYSEENTLPNRDSGGVGHGVRLGTRIPKV